MNHPQPLFQGIVPPVVTPFTEAGDVDFDSLTRLVDSLIEAGVNGLFALGSSAEVAYLTDSQRVETVTAIVAAARGRVPVIGGAIDLTTARVLERALDLQAAGVQAVVATAPIYALNDLTETAEHFRSLAAGLNVPVYAYDVPVRVHSKLPAEFLVQLGTEGVIAGVKDSSGDDVGFRRLVALNEAAGHPLQVLSGHEVIVDAMGLIGADGAVPGLANVDAAGYVRLWEAVQAGDWTLARSEQERLNRLFEIVFQDSGRSGDAAGIGAFKSAMHAQGLISHAGMAHPVQMPREAAVERIRGIVGSVALLPS
ncbi:dihydrodipicolinate synthase family protein [Arthrobacter sp.]|uniref:dihydrodipicolinate synthase family protein n=1 Tax=Arthrobacter sp. TaxID=1667 RepID=UPI0028A2C15B|nr:dihydrodipicolinate synthase family protein [Arthrobacter sp.]